MFSSLSPTSSEMSWRAGQDGDVAEHGLAALTEAGRLHGDRLEQAADLVHDEGGESLALHVLGDDQQRLARLHDLLEHGDEVVDRRDLAVHDEQVGVLEGRLLALGVGHEIRREEALVELHALGELELEPEGVGLLDRDGPVLADLVDGVGEHLADRGVRRRDGRDLGDLLTTLDLLGLVLDRRDCRRDGLFDATLERHRVGAGGHVAQTLADQRLGEHRRGGRPVAGHVVGLRGDFLHQLGAHVLEVVLELDVTGDGAHRRW